MASVNKVILVGNLGADPETRYQTSGDAITNIRVATTDKWKDKASGEMKEATEWHRVAFFGRLAEIAGEYLKKGSQVYIEGRIKTDSWDDKQTGQKRSKLYVVAENFEFLERGARKRVRRLALLVEREPGEPLRILLPAPVLGDGFRVDSIHGLP